MIIILNAEKIKAINPFATGVQSGLFVCTTSRDGDLVIVEFEKYLTKWMRAGKAMPRGAQEKNSTTPLGEEAGRGVGEMGSPATS